MYLELRRRPMSREHARPQPPAGSRRYGGGAEEPAPVPVGVTGHRTQRPRGQVGPPGPHPAQPSSSLDPGGERWPIFRPLAPLIAQLVNFVSVLHCLVRPHMMPTKTSAGPNEVVRLEVLRLAPPLGFSSRNLLFSQMGPRWAGSGSEPRGPQPTPWPTAAPGGAGREGGALHRPCLAVFRATSAVYRGCSGG